MPLTKQQIAIKCSYEGRRKPNYRPRDKLVLDGTVKLTPRRREILFHVAFTEDLWWRLERDWSSSWRGDQKFAPYLGATNVWMIVQYLRRNRLITYSSDGWKPSFGDATKARVPPILLITQRGIDALLEITAP